MTTAWVRIGRVLPYVHTHTRHVVHTYINTYIPTYLNTYIPTYLCMRTYVRTDVRTYTQTYKDRQAETNETGKQGNCAGTPGVL